MINNNDRSSISKQFYHLCCEYYKYEKFVKNKTQNIIYEGHIINEVNIQKLKNKIKYDDLKPYIEKKKKYEEIKKIIEKKNNERFNVFILKDISNSEDLIKELKDNKKRFYIINSDLFNSICVTNNGNKGIDFLIKEDKLILIFNENDKLTFKNNNCIIDISTLIKEDQDSQIEGNKENYVLNNDKKFKKDLEILIRLFYYYKEIKEKVNESFKNLNENNKETVYLINESWIKKYKKFFEFQELENILINLKDKINININSTDLITQQNYFISDSLIEIIISNLPQYYIKKIMEKYNDFDKIKENLEYNDIFYNQKQIRYLVNCHIINSKIYEILSNLYLEIENTVKRYDLYFVGNKSILLIPENNNLSKEVAEIGYINNENIFIPIILLDYNEKDIPIDFLNNFFSKNFSSNDKKDYCKTSNLDFECCFQLNKINENNINNEENKKRFEIIDINKLFDYSKEFIKILYSIYKFDNKIENNIKESLKEISVENDKKKFNKEKCYLINKNWFDKFKNIFFYKKVEDNLIDKDLKTIDKNQIINEIFEKNKNNFLKVILNNNSNNIEYNFNVFETTKYNNKNIIFPKEFYIINKKIYENLNKYNILKNYNENENENSCIINNGRLILKNDFNLNNNKLYNLFICKPNKDHSFSTEIILYFENNKNARKSIFTNFQKNKNIEYDINNPNINNLAIKINDNIYLYLYDNKEKNQEPIKTENKESKKYLELLLNIYKHHKELKQKINKSLEQSTCEKYYIVKKEWMDNLKLYLDYRNFCELIKRNNIDNNIDNYNYNEKDDKTKNKILEEFIDLFENNNLIDLNNKIKDESLKKKIIENESYNISLQEIEKKNIYYYNEIVIINTPIKDLINDLFEIEFKNKAFFLFVDQKIILKFIKNSQFSMITGFLDENDTFKAEKLLYFNNENDLTLYIDKFQKEGYSTTLNYLNNQLDINNKDKTIKGKIYNLDNNPFQPDQTEKKNNENNGRKSSIDNKIIANNINIEINNDNSINISGDGTEKNFLSNNNNKSINVLESGEEKIKLDKFIGNQIKALILYYFFFKELKQNINNKKNIKSDEIFLINKNWMNIFKNFFLYTELVENIEKILNEINPEINNENLNEIIFDKLENDFLKKINDKAQLLYSNKIFEDKRKIYYNFNQNEQLNPCIFDILSPKIYDIIKDRKETSFDLIKKDYIINEKKIIIKYEDKNSNNQLFIGTIDCLNNKFILELLLKYQNLTDMQKHFELLKNKKYNFFEKNEINKITLNPFKITITKITKIKDINKRNHIKFLFGIDFYYKLLKNINNESNSNFEKCYLIKKELITQFFELYSYKGLKDIVFNDDKTKSLINKYSQDSGYISMEKIDNFLNILINNIPGKYIDNINDKDINNFIEYIKKPDSFIITPTKFQNSKLFYFDNCIIINQYLANLIYNAEQKNNLDKLDVKYISDGKTLILNYDKILNIGFINDDNIYQPEMLIYYDNNENMNNIINDIKKDGYINFKEKFNDKYKDINIISKFINIENDNFPQNFNYSNDFSQISNNHNNFNIENNQNENNKNIGNNNYDNVKEILAKNENKIHLSDFTQNQIKSLISYDIFIFNLENNIEKNQEHLIQSDLYLINLKWMNKFKDFYVYNELHQNIKYIVKNKNIDINENQYIQKIFDNLNINYLINIMRKEQNYPYNFDDNYKPEIYNLKNIKNVKFPLTFDIIGNETYDIIKKTKQNYFETHKSSFLINHGKIIIKFEFEDAFELLIGNYNFKDRHYITEYLFYYKSKDRMIEHYNYLKEYNYKFMNNIISKNNNYLTTDNITQNNIGYILIFNQNKDIKINIIINSFYILDNLTKNNIIFILRLYFHFEGLNKKINQNIENKNEKGFVINKEIIEKYKEHYNYNEIINICNQKGIKLLIEKYKNSSPYINEENIDMFIEELIQIIPENYIDNIRHKDNTDLSLIQNYEIISLTKKLDENKEFYYFENCVILNEKLINMLCNINEKIKKNVERLNVEYLPCNKKLILIFYSFINIGFLDDNKVFQPEMIINFNKNYLNKIIHEIKTSDYESFKKSFEKFSNFNNYKIFITEQNDIVSKKSKDNDNQIQNIDNINNLQNLNFDSEEKNNILFNLNISNNNNNLKQLNNQNDYIKIKVINLISILIDSEIIKKKMKYSLSTNHKKYYSQYYIINYNWFKNYIELNNMKNIYDYLINNRIIENIIKNDNIYSNNTRLIEKIILNIKPDLFKNIKKTYEQKFSDNNNFIEISFSNLIIRENKLLYIDNFIFLSKETINLLLNELHNKQLKNIYNILIGDNQIFLQIEYNNQFTLEIGYLDNNNIFRPNLFFNYFNKNQFNTNINELISKGYKEYSNIYLLYINDYVSPIFDRNNNIIGYAYKYHDAFKDYTKYEISRHLMINIKLYFSSLILKSNFKNGQLKKEYYYLINTKFIHQYQNFYDYQNLKKELNVNTIVSQTVKFLNDKNNKDNENDLLNKKKIALIIKYLPVETNINFNEKNVKLLNKSFDCSSMPNLDLLNLGDSQLFYYADFILLDESIFNSLFNSDKNKEQKENYCQCFFIEKYILINISKSNKKCVLEICTFNSDEKICPLYLLTYNKSEDFIKHIFYIKREFGLETFLTTLQFNNTNYIELNDENNQQISIIYSLIKNNQNQNQSVTTSQINYNNNNLMSTKNFINSNNPQLMYNCFNNNNNNNKVRSFNPKTFVPIQNKKNQSNFMNFNSTKIQSQKPNIKVAISSIKEYFIYPPLIGLQNVGATCYMNATLQCFCQIEKFVNYFKYNSYVVEIEKFKNDKKNCLTYSFKYLIENLWPSKNKYFLPNYNHYDNTKKYFSPYKFKEKISNMNPLFKGVQANDSKDLVNFIIMTLHEELNKAPKNKNLLLSNFQVDQTNQMEILQNFIYCFKNENQSIISDIFYAVSSTWTQCSNCTQIKYNFQTYFFLIFPLEEIRKFKIQQFKNMYQNTMMLNPFYQQNLFNLENSKSVKMIDCFEYNQKCDIFCGENAMYCNFCKQQLPSYYKTILFTGPEILIIVLNRGKGIEFNVKLEFEENMNLKNYIQKLETGCVYKLIGVVTHLGESGASGHFIAYCKNPISNDWYQYNDELVFPVTDFKKQIIDYAMPYILFYQKVDGM